MTEKTKLPADENATRRFRDWARGVRDAQGDEGATGADGDGDIGLSLSGGGFRATLFHLGVIEALRARDRLKKVKVITSVSGGSVLAAHLVLNWHRYLGSEEAFSKAKSEVLEFIRSNPRAESLSRIPITLGCRAVLGCLEFLRVLKLLKWLAEQLNFDEKLAWLYAHVPRTSTEILARLYSTRLLGRRVLRDLRGERPQLNLLACNLTLLGSNSHFDGDGYCSGDADGKHVPCGNLPIGLALAASSAFPVIFEPLTVTPELLGVKRGDLLPTRQALTDGGVFDNLGVNRLLQVSRERHAAGMPLSRIIVSDAGGALDVDDTSSFHNPLFRLTRVSEVLYRQVTELQKQQVRERADSIVIDIRDVLENHPTLSEAEQRSLEFIRTDLDAFSQTEIESLVDHGRALAWHAISGGSADQTQPAHCDSKVRDKGSYLRELKRGRRQRLGFTSLVRRPVIALYAVALFVAAWSGIPLIRRQCQALSWPLAGIKATSIGGFLVRPSTQFGSELSRSDRNMHFVGLVNQYTLSNYAEPIGAAIERGVDIGFLLYLPELGEGLEEIPSRTLAEYVQAFRRYRPHGDQWLPALQKFWSELDVTPNALQGKVTKPLPAERLETGLRVRFYSDMPKGWLVVYDVLPDYSDARAIYWFPYLAQARELDRPGIRVAAQSALGRELLKWLARLNGDEASRAATPAEIEAWKTAIAGMTGTTREGG